SASEHELQRQLYKTGAASTAGLGHVVGARAAHERVVQSESRVDREQVRGGELRMVEDIEHLRLELQPAAAAQLEVLDERQVEVVDARSAQAVAASGRKRPGQRLYVARVRIVGEVPDDRAR